MSAIVKSGISAVIPVKADSSRLKNKNILPFAESNLLIHKIRQLKKADRISEIIVSSDSDEMLYMARQEKVKAVKRPEMYADESQPFGFFLEYICGIMEYDTLMWACCTSPLVETCLYEEAITLYNKKIKEGYDSLITVMKYQHFLLDENGPKNFSRGLEHKNSQDLPVYYYFTNGIILSKRESVLKWYYHFGPKVFKMEVSQMEAIDIDTYEDYIIAKAFYDEKIRGGEVDIIFLSLIKVRQHEYNWSNTSKNEFFKTARETAFRYMRQTDDMVGLSCSKGCKRI